jgi:Tripartite tricarboxylate transporter TctB family
MTNRITLMSSPEQAAPASSPQAEDLASLRSDFLSALGWMGLGTAILIGSVMMDRLEKQDINPYTIPGLLPGLLGIAMTILGALLAVRSWRPRLLASAVAGDASAHRAERRRLLLVLGLSLGFGVVLVGHGLPFWLAAAIFVTVAILSLQAQQRKSTGQRLTLRMMVATAAIGLGAGVAITIVFQDLFLVRLP